MQSASLCTIIACILCYFHLTVLANYFKFMRRLNWRFGKNCLDVNDKLVIILNLTEEEYIGDLGRFFFWNQLRVLLLCT